MTPPGTRPPGRVRIIGGTLRGRRLMVPEHPGLRPTGDRVRETLFNWLRPHLPGSRCLDCFAGTGALGFEASSRGAGRVLLLELDPRQARALRVNAEALGARQVDILNADALDWLERQQSEPFDLVFLDPPFAAGLLAPSCHLLAKRGWLAPGALVYLETAANAPWPPLPAGWDWWREGRAGRVRFALAATPGSRGDLVS